MTGKDEIRFWNKVSIGDGCWEWQAARSAKGYGVFQAKIDGRFGAFRAHRYILGNPEGVVMHLCDNPPCVRPNHLKVGTHAENIKDRDAKGRTARGFNHGQTKKKLGLV